VRAAIGASGDAHDAVYFIFPAGRIGVAVHFQSRGGQTCHWDDMPGAHRKYCTNAALRGSVIGRHGRFLVGLGAPGLPVTIPPFYFLIGVEPQLTFPRSR